MNDDAYNELLDRIRKMKPRPASGEKLTNDIMKFLDEEIREAELSDGKGK